MQKKGIKKAIFWDVDGTLFCSYQILHPVYAKAVAKINAKYAAELAPPLLEDIVQVVGRTPAEMFPALFPSWSKLPANAREELRTLILDGLVYCISQEGQGEHYPDVHAVLSALRQKGYFFFAASNGRFPYIDAILSANRTKAFFLEMGAVGLKKGEYPHKLALVQDTIKRYELRPQDAFLIGDRQVDNETAQSCGLQFIAATYGHGHASEWNGATHRIACLKDLLSIL